MGDKFDNRGLNHGLPMEEELPVNLLAGIFRDKSQSYKLFWFQAIVEAVCTGKTAMDYDYILNQMISKAWYMVIEYHLNLGPSDAIEILIKELSQKFSLMAAEKNQNIISFLMNTQEQCIKEAKRKLALNVPYRLQSPFLGQLTESEWRNYDYVASLTRQNERVLYYYERLNNNKKHIHINGRWVSYIIKNEAILKGWIQNELIQYLQKRNPNVPGIPFKLKPPEKRDLKIAIKFWNTVISHYEITDVYTGNIINEESISKYGKIAIDHFMPWSYVASDEMWNLTPTFASINSSKSNYLPGRKSDKDNLARQQFMVKHMASENKNIGKLYETFKKKHINGTDIEDRLYNKQNNEKEFDRILGNIITPIYISANNMGFKDWEKRNYEVI